MTCPHLWQEFHLQQPSPSMFHLGFIKARSSKVELKTSGRIGIDEKPWVVLKMVNPIYIYIDYHMLHFRKVVKTWNCGGTLITVTISQCKTRGSSNVCSTTADPWNIAGQYRSPSNFQTNNRCKTNTPSLVFIRNVPN